MEYPTIKRAIEINLVYIKNKWIADISALCSKGGNTDYRGIGKTPTEATTNVVNAYFESEVLI
jgi:hypothetical protein